MKKICPRCNVEFETEYETKIWCSRRCGKAITKDTPATCVICGKAFTARGRRICCSDECTKQHKHNLTKQHYFERKRKGIKYPSDEKVRKEWNFASFKIYIKTCSICGRHNWHYDKCLHNDKPFDFSSMLGSCRICGKVFWGKGQSCSKSCQEKAKCDPRYSKHWLKRRITRAISTRFSQFIRGYKTTQSSKWEGLLDYSFDQLKQHIESTWLPDMSWDNYGTEWQIDHHIPMVLHDFSNAKKGVRAAYSLSNLNARWKTTAIAKLHGSNQIGNIEKKDRLCV